MNVTPTQDAAPADPNRTPPGARQAGARDSDGSDDTALIEGLKRGDEAAAIQLVTTHIGWMRGLAMRLLKDPVLAEDTVQDAFIKALRNIDKFEERAALKTWLHRITVNEGLMRLRKAKRLAEEPIDDLMPVYDRTDHRVEEPWAKLPDPDEMCERKDTGALVRSKISELPDGYRIVLQLRDIEELSTREVAELLDLTESAVKVRLHRARAALKTLLEPFLRRGAI